MMIKVRCRCAQRTIDTDKVGAWKLRCKTCQEIIYDPQSAGRGTDSTVEEHTNFDRWLQESNELKVLMSSDGEPDGRTCKKHPKYNVVAACNRCGQLLCKRCLDRIDEAFTCADCVAQLVASREKEATFFARVKRFFGLG